MNKSLIEEKIANAEKALQDNARQIDQLELMKENAISYGNKLLGKLEAYREMLDDTENKEAAADDPETDSTREQKD